MVQPREPTMISRLCRAQQPSPIGKRLQALIGLAGNDVLDLALLLDNGDALRLALGIGDDGDLEAAVLLSGVFEAEAVIVAVLVDVGVGLGLGLGIALGVTLGSSGGGGEFAVVTKGGTSTAGRSSTTKEAIDGADRTVKGQAEEIGSAADTGSEDVAGSIEAGLDGIEDASLLTRGL